MCVAVDQGELDDAGWIVTLLEGLGVPGGLSPRFKGKTFVVSTDCADKLNGRHWCFILDMAMSA